MYLRALYSLEYLQCVQTQTLFSKLGHATHIISHTPRLSTLILLSFERLSPQHILKEKFVTTAFQSSSRPCSPPTFSPPPPSIILSVGAFDIIMIHDELEILSPGKIRYRSQLRCACWNAVRGRSPRRGATGCPPLVSHCRPPKHAE